MIAHINETPVAKQILDHLGLESQAPPVKPVPPTGPEEAETGPKYDQGDPSYDRALSRPAASPGGLTIDRISIH